MKIRIFILAILLLSFAIGSCLAATYYMATTGSNSNSGDSTHPWLTLQYSFTRLSKGDTLIIKDGTYTGDSNVINSTHVPPLGSAWTTGNYTIIKAEHDGAAIFDGQNARDMVYRGSSTPVTGYWQFEGIVWCNPASSTVTWCYVNRFKFLRCGAYEATAGNTVNWFFRGCTYGLLEGCYAYGGGRYKFLAYDGCQYMIFRNCVGRLDWADAGGTGDSYPIGGFVVYQSYDIYFQNCILIDSDQDSYWTGGKYSAFYMVHNSGTTENVYIDNCIALNSKFAPIQIDSGTGLVQLTNFVGWNCYKNDGGAINNYLRGDNTIINKSTIGVAIVPSGYNYHFYNDGAVASIKNTIIYSLANGYALRGMSTKDYNCYYSNTNNDYDGTPGTHSKTAINPIANSLKYITRIESGSDLSGQGESGADIGANVKTLIGTSGTLYGETGYATDTGISMWPFPNEDLIRTKMKAYSGSGVSGNRGFCADGTTLTKYIWEYLGNTIPADIYGTENSAPVLAAIGNKSVNENAALTFTISATDADGDTLTYSASGLPTGATLNSSSGAFAWTPTYAQAGSYTVTFTVTDEHGATDSEAITITVANINTIPVLAAIGNKTVNEGAQLQFSTSATDADGDTLSYSASGLPTGATFASQTFTWTPTYSQSGSYNVTFTADDSHSGIDSETITITVNNVNGPPVLGVIGNKTVAENSLLTFTVTATDPEGDTLTLSATNLPSGATFTPATGVFSWTPDYTQAATYTAVHFAVTDGSLTDTEDITITVTNTNRTPVLAAIGNKSVNENAALAFILSATDADGDTLTYSASGLPTGATLNSSSGAFAWTPTYTQAGTYTVTFTVTDTNSATDSETITITVSNVNRAPVLGTIGNKAVAENSTLTFTVTATDDDSDTLTYSASNLPSGATFNTTTKVFSWTPSYSQAATYTAVHFAVTDGSLSDTEDITITVTNTNRAPVLNAIGNKSINEGVHLEFTVSASDPDGDTVTITTSTLQSWMSFNGATFIADPGYTNSGNYNVTFTASDGSLTASETITISIGNVNRPPELELIGNKAVAENSLLTFTVSATDPDGTTLTYSASNLPSGATFNTTTKVFSWTPSYSQAATYTAVHFAVTDGSLTDTEDITITVSNSNRAPVLATIGNKSVNENALLQFTVSATDADGDTLTYSASGLPAGATFASQAFSWTPSYAESGTYSATFSVSDSNSATASETITITVGNVNRAPVLAEIGSKTIEENSTLTFTVAATDADLDTITLSAANLPTGASFAAATGVFSWIPTLTQAGTYSVIFTATDTNSASDSDIISITVENRDLEAPYTEGLNPAADEVQVPLNTNILLHIKDSGEGVDINTISLKIKRESDSAAKNIIVNGVSQLSAYPNSVAIKGSPSDYIITYDPPNTRAYNFKYQQTVTLTVSAADLIGNTLNNSSYSFTTSMILRGANVKLSKR